MRATYFFRMKNNSNKKITLIIITGLLLLSFTAINTVYNPLASDMSNYQDKPVLNYEKENWWLTELELLSETSIGQSTYPEIAIDSDDNIHIVWQDSTNDLLSSGVDIDIFYRLYDSSIESWSVLELVSTESTLSSVDPCLEVDSEGNVHVCWIDITDYLGSGGDWDVFYKTRSPVGVWSTTEVLSTLSDSHSANMDIAIDSKDNIHLAYKDNSDILGADTDDDIFYQWFDNSLSSWSAEILVTTESTGPSDWPSIAIDPIFDTPYFAWVDITDLLSSGSDLDIYSRSYDHTTSSFSSVLLVTEESSGHSYAPTIAFNSKGVPSVVWHDYAINMLDSGADVDIFHKSLNTISLEWVGLEVISSESNENAYEPHCVIDKEDRIYVIWYDYSELLFSGTDVDIFFKYKDPSATAWSDIKLVTTLSDNLATIPKIAVDTKGFVSCTWFDYDDLLSAGTDADIFYKQFVGTPSTPSLYPIYPNPASEVNLTLNWDYNPYASSYSLYRSTSPFTFATIGSMVPITTLSSNSFNDTLNETGLYFYGVVAHNEYGGSGLSNVESVRFNTDSSSSTEGFLGFLGSLSVLEIVTITGAIVLSQAIIAVIVVVIAKAGSKGSTSKSKGKKKK